MRWNRPTSRCFAIFTGRNAIRTAETRSRTSRCPTHMLGYLLLYKSVSASSPSTRDLVPAGPSYSSVYRSKTPLTCSFIMPRTSNVGCFFFRSPFLPIFIVIAIFVFIFTTPSRLRFASSGIPQAWITPGAVSARLSWPPGDRRQSFLYDGTHPRGTGSISPGDQVIDMSCLMAPQPNSTCRTMIMPVLYDGSSMYSTLPTSSHE